MIKKKKRYVFCMSSYSISCKHHDRTLSVPERHGIRLFFSRNKGSGKAERCMQDIGCVCSPNAQLSRQPNSKSNATFLRLGIGFFFLILLFPRVKN